MSSHNNTFSPSITNDNPYLWILEHLLTNPGTYEIPLRTMYSLNSTQQSQPLPRQSGRAGTPTLPDGSPPDLSPASPYFPPDQQQQHLAAQIAAEHFRSCLLTHISRVPSQPYSLPPGFVTSFVRRCFTEDLVLVDFTQALTALDYLKDLENRRKRELTLVLHRLGLDRNTFSHAAKEITTKHPRIAEWLLRMQAKERKVEALYTQVYLGLRRWTLINEMRLEPFSKANCIAMLNTLYPPTTAHPPTRQLNHEILAKQRNAFFRYIQGVERNGKGILKNLELQGQRATDDTGWPPVRDTVDKYLRTTNGVIDECMQVSGPEFFTPAGEEFRRADRRADSGVSFAIGDRPSTSSSIGSHRKPSTSSLPNEKYSTAYSANDKPLPVSPTLPPPSPKKPKSALEKIISNFRSRNDVKEPTGNEGRDRVRSLKKMKSTSSIGVARAKHGRSGSGDHVPFEIDDAKRQRLILEARRDKENQIPNTRSRGQGRSYEV